MTRNFLRFAARVLPLVALVVLGRVDDGGRSSLRAESPQNGALHAEMLADAELNDLFFLDPDRGWAVGDRGAIWTTDDGGRSWRAQESPTACRWESVWFVDSKNGWVVGGWHHPGTFQSRGAVLRTRDGGLNWMPVPTSTLPLLRKVQFRDDQHGWAIGEPTGIYPSGVFQSDDGGRSWQPVHSTVGGPWLAGDFVGARAALARLHANPAESAAPGKLARRVPRQGVVAGRNGRVALITDEGLVDMSVEATRGRHVRSVSFDPDQGAWLAGDDGLLLHSRDGGLNWSPPPQEPPAATTNAHWRGIAAHGAHTWIVGDPGSHVLHSADGGASWELQLTGQSLPLRAVWFLDAHHGWAAGALGTLLSTRDGGRTWKRQRGGGRAAVLGIFAHESAIPLEMFAQIAGNDGYLSVVELPFRRDVEAPAPDDESLESRVQAALLSVGGSAAHMASEFPVRQSGLRLPQEQWIAGWNQVHGGRGVERLTEYLVERLRVWRPDVIVTEDAARDPHDSLAPLTRQLVLLAVQRAADPQAYPDQIGQAGLNPWRVKRVLSYMGTAEKGAIQLPTTQLAPRWSRPLGDIASTARFLLERHPSAAPPSLAFRILFDDQPQGATRRDLLAGVSIPSGGDGRRQVADSPRGELTDLTRLVQRQRTLQQLMLRSSESGGGANPAWLAQLDDAIQGFGKQTAGEVYWQLGQRFHEAGQTQIALETWQHLASRLPHHDLSDAALLRLLELHGSSEVRWRREKGARAAAEANAAAAVPFTSVRPATAEFPIVDDPKSSSNGPRRGAPAVVKPAAVAVEATPGSSPTAQAERLGKLLEQSRPALFADPRVRLQWLAALRAADRATDVDSLLRAAARPSSDDVWQQALAHEAWLAVPLNRKMSVESWPRSAVKAPLASTRPRLDGELDEALWSTAATLELRSELNDDDDWPATVRIARDREFLYLAAVCQRAPGRTYEQPTMPRPRDADLAGMDRVEFHVDVDRDGATAWKLACDERGWTFESCAGDAHWNPTWYVAARQDERAWTVEAAIPFDELAPTSPAEGTVWSLGVQRIVPGRGFQSWSRPASASAAQSAGFGWLRFE